jgi:hypothetical protein
MMQVQNQMQQFADLEELTPLSLDEQDAIVGGFPFGKAIGGGIGLVAGAVGGGIALAEAGPVGIVAGVVGGGVGGYSAGKEIGGDVGNGLSAIHHEEGHWWSFV